ncbi:hypothetical protein [Clostridium aciditolerans]|nr:hypothetical protein [Clostridium aciditolerans]
MVSYGVAYRQMAIPPLLVEVGVFLPRLDEFKALVPKCISKAI